MIELLNVDRSAQRPDGARRQRGGRVPCRDSVDPGLRVLRQADHHRLGSHPHRPCLVRPDAASRIHEVRRAGRRLGGGHHRSDGRARHLRNCSASTPTCRASSPRTWRRRFAPLVAAPAPSGLSTDERRAYEQVSDVYTKGIGYAVEMLLHPQTLYGLADSPVALAAWMLDHDAQSYEDIARAFVDRTPRRQPHARRDPRQHHAHLADEHGGLVGPPVPGEHVRLLRRQGRLRPDRRDRVSRGSSTRLRGAGPSRPTPTSSTSTRSTRAATSPPGRSPQLFSRRGSRGLPVAPVGDRVRARAHALARRGDRVAQLRATRPRRAARPRRPGELLDADLHQLAAPGALRPRLVAGLPGRRAGRHRRPHAGVLLRARHRPRAAGGAGARDRLPGRGRQRLRDLERLRQPLLAGALLRRRGRHHPRPPLRRRTLRASRSASSSGCSASSASPSPSKGSAWRRRPTGTTCAPPRPTSATGAASGSPRPHGAALDERRAYALPERLRLEPLGPRRRVDDRAREGRARRGPAGASPTGSTRATRTSCCLPERASRSPSACSWTARPRARSHGVDVDEDGNGLLREGRLYQLVREHDDGPPADAEDHLSRARRRGVRVHVRVAG